MNMMMRFTSLVLCGLLSASCSGQDIDWNKLEKAEKKFQERQRQTLIVAMSLETMFPDPQVRALAKAASRGDTEKIDRLVAEGVDVNARGTSGATPLYPAMNSPKGFEHLLKLGADPNVLYGEQGVNGTVMHFAMWLQDSQILELALTYGGDPNLKQGPTKETPIFEAAGPDNKEKIPILLDAGADMNAQLLNGATPMIVAAGLGQFDTVYKLLELGADYTLASNSGTLANAIAFRRRTMAPETDLYQWMQRVIKWLADRGVEIPEWQDPSQRKQ